MRNWQKIAMLATAFALLGGGVFLALNMANPASSAVTVYSYNVVQTYPHDSSAFTEGLVYANGVLYESTGLYGSSTLRRVSLENGSVLQHVALPAQYFAEGITIVGDKIIQLTWREHTAFIYDKATFNLVGNFSYETDGWGLTFDGARLIMSDGTSTLHFLDPSTYQPVGDVQVHDGNVSVANLNELEYVKGDVYANIWMQQKIAIINPQTGQVKAYINLEGIEPPNVATGQNVLNGIAYDQENSRLFVTGKNWPQLFEINLIPSTS